MKTVNLEVSPVSRSPSKSPRKTLNSRKAISHIPGVSRKLLLEDRTSKESLYDSEQVQTDDNSKDSELSNEGGYLSFISLDSNDDHSDDNAPWITVADLKNKQLKGKFNLKVQVDGLTPSLDFVEENPTSILWMVCKNCCFTGSLFQMLDSVKGNDSFMEPWKYFSRFACQNCLANNEELAVYFNISVTVKENGRKSVTLRTSFSGSHLESFLGCEAQEYLTNLRLFDNVKNKLESLVQDCTEMKIWSIERKEGPRCNQIVDVTLATK